MLLPAAGSDNDDFGLWYRLAHKGQAQRIAIALYIERQTAAVTQTSVKKTPLNWGWRVPLWCSYRLAACLDQYRRARRQRKVCIFTAWADRFCRSRLVNDCCIRFNDTVESSR